VTWLSDNWKILFSGVLGTAFVAVIGYYLRKWQNSQPRDAGGLTAQGSKVDRSAVASGSGITQRIGDEHHHHYSATSVSPAPAQISLGAQAKPTKQPKRLTTGSPRTERVSMAPDSKFFLDTRGEPSVLAQFINEPDDEGQNVRVTAKARIVFYGHDDKELCRINDGCWLDECVNTKEFDFDESHELVLCTLIEGQLLVFRNARTADNYVAEEDTGPDCFPIEGFTSGIVDVRLTNKHTGAVLNHSRFTLTTEPLVAKLQTA
jgi:hypothetical protein